MRRIRNSLFLLFSLVSICAVTIAEKLRFITEPDVLPTSYSSSYKPGSQLVLLVNDKRAGFINIHGYANSPTVGGIHTFYVYPEFRGHGYGRMLLQHARDTLVTQGKKKILITPFPLEFDEQGKPHDLEGAALEEAMPRLVRLYNSVGFKTDPQYTVNMQYLVPTQSSFSGNILYGLVALAAIALLYVLYKRYKKTK
jgi:GNAT superfamily N-acetyltransferase